MLKRLFPLIVLLCALPIHATTWFIRADGGTRFSTNITSGQCNGTTDAAYPGTGVNQNCAYNDFRYLWDDDSGAVGVGVWVIAGGDTVVVRGCHALATQMNPANPACRVGWDINTGGGPSNNWCGGVGPYNCFGPPIPSGTSGAHTKILGGCAYDSTPGPCFTGNVTNHANLTTIFGGMGLTWMINIQGSQYVDFNGIELTTHNKVNSGTAFVPSATYSVGQIIFDGTNTQSVTVGGAAGTTPSWNATVGGTTTTGAVTFRNLGPNCVRAGTPAYPVGCITSPPMDDYDANGFISSATTGNITFTDLWVHGFAQSGFYGPIGFGQITMTRVNASFNAFAGWNFDEGQIGPNSTGFPNDPRSSIVASYVTMDWNGCNQEYPMRDAIPCLVAYSIINGGFGDAWSGQDSNLASMSCDHCEMSNNIKDAFFGPHTAIGSVTITNSTANNNGGQTWKGNLGVNGSWVMKNSVTNGNCLRLSRPVTGAPSNYNQGIDVGNNLCRADGATIAVVWPINGSFELDNNTFVSASTNVGFDFSCFSLATGIASIVTGGTGYAVNDVIYAGGGGTVVTVTSIGSGGVITGLSLTTAGHVVNPFETYNFDSNGSGSGLTFNLSTTPATCGGGTRILRNNNFIGYTNTDNVHWNSSTINFICYSSCQGNPGNSNDSQWTTRSNNTMYGYQNGVDGACTYAGESCASPLMTIQPVQTWTSETQLDPYNPTLTASANSFYPTSGSPLVHAGIAIAGITTDYFGVARPNPPTIGGVEPFGGVAPPSGLIILGGKSVLTGKYKLVP